MGKLSQFRSPSRGPDGPDSRVSSLLRGCFTLVADGDVDNRSLALAPTMQRAQSDHEMADTDRSRYSQHLLQRVSPPRTLRSPALSATAFTIGVLLFLTSAVGVFRENTIAQSREITEALGALDAWLVFERDDAEFDELRAAVVRWPPRDDASARTADLFHSRTIAQVTRRFRTAPKRDPST